MIDYSSNFQFFLPQIFFGSLSGVLLALLGMLLVLRRMTFFGITLSQGVSFSVAVCLLMQWKGDLVPVFLSLGLAVLLLMIQRSPQSREEVVLGVFFLFFAALSQFLLSLGGNVQNHLMSAYFGDILTSQIEIASVLLCSLCLILFIFYFQKFVWISFDRDDYQIRQGSPIYYDVLFYGILTICISVAVNSFGSFFSMSHLVLPSFSLLPWLRSFRSLAWGVSLFSLAGTSLGFFGSLIGYKYRGEEIFFPTSSTIILVLCFFGGISVSLQWFWKKLRR